MSVLRLKQQGSILNTLWDKPMAKAQECCLLNDENMVLGFGLLYIGRRQWKVSKSGDHSTMKIRHKGPVLVIGFLNPPHKCGFRQRGSIFNYGPFTLS